MISPQYKYAGKGERLSATPGYSGETDPDIEIIPDMGQFPYVPYDERLIKAVNIALALRRPLLVEGEPGCGKTSLARSVAYELNWPLVSCFIRSTTTAQDLLYTFDGLKRLYDIQEAQIREKKKGEETSLPGRSAYVRLGKLGKAIQLATENIPCVVLIDEIDKANRSLPNDLLALLDTWKYDIGELDGKLDSDNSMLSQADALLGQQKNGAFFPAERLPFLPLVIITSNREKTLPAPFLRRVLYHYIPDALDPQLREIIQKQMKYHHENPDDHDELIGKAIKKYQEIRGSGLEKKPGTSELIEWVYLLTKDVNSISDLNNPDLELGRLPYLEVLIKSQADRERLGAKN